VAAIMSIWRPAPAIRFKALGLHWRGDALLAVEITADDGRVKGVRPLGGTVAFGETAEAAVIREFEEELGIAVRTSGPPMFVENIYTHEGHTGHEVLAIFKVVFPDGAFADQTRITFREDSGTECHAGWFPLDQLDGPDGPRLYPDGLKDRLLAR
jgi:8-oxo-dGTP pyrophosphatase MutT (NUDIX family)